MKRWIAIGILTTSLAFLSTAYYDTEAELGKAEAELGMTEMELSYTKGELETTTIELEATKADLLSRNTELEIIKQKSQEKEAELADLQISYEGLMAEHGYTIKDPTYREMLKFLREDNTDKDRYLENEYVCTDFAAEVCNNAEEEDIRCAYVYLMHPEDIAHAIIAFNTIDKGLIYIEPQYDEQLRGVEIGESFHDCLGSGYEKPDYDDTIEKIVTIW